MIRSTRLRPGLPLLGALALSACAIANTEKDFLCDPQTGMPCATLSEVDGSLVGAGIGSVVPIAEAGLDTQAKSLSRDPLLGTSKGAMLGRTTASSMSAAAPGDDGGPAYAAARYRVPEKTGRLWIAPRLDADRVLHEATYVHFVVREAAWGNGR